MPNVEILRKDAPDAILPEGFTVAIQTRLESGEQLLVSRHHGPLTIRFPDEADASVALARAKGLVAQIDGDWADKYEMRVALND